MAIATETQRLLRQVPLFKSLTDADFTALLELAVEQRFKAGEVIFTEGSQASGLYLVEDGEVEVRNRVKILARLGRGECFGEMSMISGENHSATVTALTACGLVILHKRDFQQALHRIPAMGESLLEMMAHRLRDANENVREFGAVAQEIEGLSHAVGRVANQTHILAINAGIEAARAGEAGRGFGVVAAEMRKLADESHSAVQKIQGLIAQIRKRTQ